MFLTATDQRKPQTALWRLLTLIITLIGIAGSAAGTASASTITSINHSSGRTASVGLETRVGVTNQNLAGSSARISTESPACVGENLPVYGGFVLASCVATKPASALSDASDAAFKAADDIDNFTVGNKHLPGAGGKWNKFRAGVDPKSIIEEALRSPNAKFLPDATPGRFKVVVDMGTQVGEKAGQTAVRVVVTNDGKIITAFPVNP